MDARPRKDRVMDDRSFRCGEVFGADDFGGECHHGFAAPRDDRLAAVELDRGHASGHRKRVRNMNLDFDFFACAADNVAGSFDREGVRQRSRPVAGVQNKVVAAVLRF